MKIQTLISSLSFGLALVFLFLFKSHSAVQSTSNKALCTRLQKYFLIQSSIFQCCCPLCCFCGLCSPPRVGGLLRSSPLADRCCCIWVAWAGTCTHCPPPPAPLSLIRSKLMSCRCLFSQNPSDWSERWRCRRAPSLFFITY